MALAAGLGLLRLGAKSFWLDESVSARQTTLDWGERWNYVSSWDVNMAPHHLLLGLWAGLGRSEAWLRLPSVFFTVATVGVTYAIGARLLDRRSALVGAGVLALNPLVVAHAQEARGYAMAMLAAALASLLLLRAVEDPSPGRLAAWVAASAVLPYTHFFGFLVIGAHALATLSAPHLRLIRARLFGGFACIGVLSSPLLWFILDGGDRGQINWIPTLTPVRMVGLFPRLAANDNLLLALFVFVALTATLVLSVWRARGRGWGAAGLWPWVFLLSWLVSPVIVGAAVSVVKPIFVPRYFIVVAPALALLAGAGLVSLAALGGPRWRTVVAAAFMGASVWALVEWYADHPKEDWRGAARTVLAEAEPADAVVFLPPSSRYPVEWYMAEKVDVLVPVFPDRPWGAFLQASAIGRLSRGDALSVAEDHERVWVIARVTADGREDEERARLEAALDAEHDVAGSWQFTDVDAVLYERSPTVDRAIRP